MTSRRLAAALGAVVVLAGCGNGAGTSPVTQPAPTTSSGVSSPTPSAKASPTAAATPTTTGPSESEPTLEGIDASHHKGPIDWAQVADAGITFAYLKATEGTGFTDPRFAEHRREAARQGIEVSGYHYFQLCSDGADQAAHFLRVLGDGVRRARLVPALDLELAGSCSDPPPADVLLVEVREFLAALERRTGRPALVYLYPEFEERYGFADDLAEHPQWVRRLGDRAPRRDWTVWQYDDAGSVPGVAGGVDRNLMKESFVGGGR